MTITVAQLMQIARLTERMSQGVENVRIIKGTIEGYVLVILRDANDTMVRDLTIGPDGHVWYDQTFNLRTNELVSERCVT